MLKLAVKDLRPGMITSQSVYNTKGASYLTRGTEITSEYIQKLHKLGIAALNVTSLMPGFDLMPPDDVVEERTRVTAIHCVTDTFDEIVYSNSLNPAPLEKIAENILLDIFRNREHLAQLTDIRLHDTYTFAHCVNVAVLSAMLGNFCRLDRRTMLDLIMGSLLHDIGKVLIPLKILNKPTKLSDNEYDIIKEHPEAGRKKINEMHVFTSAIPSIIAAQHHEHLSGNGYPHGIKAESIHRLSRIVAIADVYDALTSARPYKKPYKPHVAYKIMNVACKGQFDTELLKLFFDNVAIYPVGTLLKTSRGFAIVKEMNFGATNTPLVLIFADNSERLLRTPYLLDLREAGGATIENVLEDKEAASLIRRCGCDPAIFLKDGAL